MKLRALFIIIPLAYLLSGCGQSGSVAQPPQTNTNTDTNNGALTNNNNNNGNTNTNSCTRTAKTSGVIGAPFPGTARGSGQDVVVIGFNNPQYTNGVKTDQDLRFTITPNGAGKDTTNNGTQPYQEMAVTVNLIEIDNKTGFAAVLDGTFGTVDTSTQVPKQTGRGVYGPNIGIPTDQPSAIIDFSSYLSPGHSYQFQVSQIMTDWTCQTACTTAYAASACNWQFDYYGCVINYLSNCEKKNCDVAPANATSTWSLNIAVETDVTTCLGN